MRDLGAGYSALVAAAAVAPAATAAASGWGGAPDPLDLTPWLVSASVEMELREIGGAVLELDNGEGEFDPLDGAYAGALSPGTAVTVQMALSGSYWTVYTGYVLEANPVQAAGERRVAVRLGPAARDLSRLQITSAHYEPYGATPAYWTAEEIVTDLFREFAGLAESDLDLSPTGLEIPEIQFEGEGLWEAGQACLLPAGYRLYWRWDGKLCSGPLVPDSWAAAWEIPADAVERIELTAGPPEATRILVAGGPDPAGSASIGEEEEWADGRYAWDHPSGNTVLGGGDCIEYWLRNHITGVETFYAATYLMAGPQGQPYRRSEIQEIEITYCEGHALCQRGRFTPDDAGSLPFTTFPQVVSEWWDSSEERMKCLVTWQTAVEDDLWIDFSFKVVGHPYQLTEPAVDAQAWDDDLIEAWGEMPRQVSAPACWTWAQAQLVADAEMEFARRSTLQATVLLATLDLRAEPGDVVSVARSPGDPITVWVQSVRHAVATSGARTELRGYVVT